MKKEYVKPEALEIEIENANICAGSCTGDAGTGGGTGICLTDE